MPRTYVKKRLFSSYSEESLRLALLEVEKGKAVYSAAKNHKIPYETLRRWVFKSPSHKGSGRLPIFSKEEEKLIVEILKFMAYCGFPQDRNTIKFIICNYVQSLPKLQHPFTNNVPGLDWIRNFEKRWVKELNSYKLEILADILGMSRAKGLSSDILEIFYEMYADLLVDEGFLNSPERIFNLDVAGLGNDCHKNEVFLGKLAHPVYIKSLTGEIEMYTVLFCISADGKYMPPFTVYKSVDLHHSWTQGGPVGATYTCTESGCMQGPIFEQWIKTFSTYVKNVKKPVLLIYGGHKSHLTYKTIRHAIENQIIILRLPPNTNHTLQPLDIGVFSYLKRKWENILKLWFSKSCMQYVSEDVFPDLLKQLYNSLSSDDAVKGFRESGLFPPKNIESNMLFMPPSNSRENVFESQSQSPLPNKSLATQQSSSCKRMKHAILTAVSLSPSKPTLTIMQNSKRKRKRIQTNIKASTSDEVLKQLQKDNAHKKAKKLKKDEKVNIQQTNIHNKLKSKKQTFSVGSWATVEYSGKKTKQKFIGQIVKYENDSYHMKFLKKSKIGNFYILPEVEDIDIIDKKMIIDILNEPSLNKRGHYIFDKQKNVKCSCSEKS